MSSDYARIEKAIRYIETSFLEQPDLKSIAENVHLSEFHFQRLFTRWAGVSPKKFLQYLTVEHAKKKLADSRSLLETTLDSGLSSPSRLHDLFISIEAMTPGQYKLKGKGIVIEYGFIETPFGKAMVAATSRGICGFSFPKTETLALRELVMQWSDASIVKNQKRIQNLASKIFDRGKNQSIHLVARGTGFQLKVWEAILKIPPGSVLSYQDVARMIGNPKAARAVGSALAQNTIGFLIPCHRVIQDRGLIGQYRWDSTRKKAMLSWEEAKSAT